MKANTDKENCQISYAKYGEYEIVLSHLSRFSALITLCHIRKRYISGKNLASNISFSLWSGGTCDDGEWCWFIVNYRYFASVDASIFASPSVCEMFPVTKVFVMHTAAAAVIHVIRTTPRPAFCNQTASGTSSTQDRAWQILTQVSIPNLQSQVVLWHPCMCRVHKINYLLCQ